ncbi:MAG: outer membrane beta-barrel protein [Methylacidiphilales bacterium]|nr:outer membrane beta-barrel protein [Candidatus Methylacidiphilales bacterium]
MDPNYLPVATDNLTASTPVQEPSASSTSSTQPATAEAGETPKFYTITAELRETYDDNPYTSTTDKTPTFETSITPSILFDVPMENSQFDSRLTFDATNYAAESSDSTQISADFLARFTHQFSDRFAIDVRDETGYFYEPSLFSYAGSPYQDGNYISQSFSTDFTAQWTPLVSTVSSFSNSEVFYDNSAVAEGEDYIQNSFSQSIGFSILPKYTLVFAGLYSGISYNNIGRGYNSYTGMTGIDWAVLPTMSASVRVGASYTQVDEVGGDTTTPYATASLDWQLGHRSHLEVGYSYSVVPTDVTTASGQVASRVYANFNYDISRSLSAHLNLAENYGDYATGFVQSNTTGTFTEWDSALDVGLTYHISNHFDANIGYTFSDVSSQLSYRDYTRNQYYFGIRGSY